MAATSKTSVFSSADIQFLLTFAAGMGGFWLSGHLPALVPVRLLPHSYAAVMIIALVLALGIYAGGMALWLLVVLGQRRSRRSILAGSLTVGALALVSSLLLTKIEANLEVTPVQLAFVAFVLYMVYGAYYVVGWLVARRLTRA